jgi:CelD/BcsL family acetyltransferase involved in cellulose biosynthesis
MVNQQSIKPLSAHLTPEIASVIIKRIPLDQIASMTSAPASANPFYRPDQLHAALSHLGVPDTIVILGGYDRQGDLVGLLPLVQDKGYARLPIRYWRNYTHPFCFLQDPLIEPEHMVDFWQGVFQWLEKHSRLPFLRLTGLSEDMSKGLCRVDTDRFRYSPLREDRAILHSSLGGEDYINQTIRKKKRKEYNRLQNRLSEMGDITYEEYNSGDDFAPWLEEFLTLEHQGWKGKAGTSLLSNQDHQEYFRAACASAAKSNSLFMGRLCLDGKTIASVIGFVENNILYTIKICFDEAYSRFSPGVMLELALTKSALDNHKFAMVDSCAKPDHAMINHIWGERREISQWIIALQGGRGLILARLTQNLEILSRKFNSNR